MVKNESVGFSTQNCKQRQATKTRAKTETTATTTRATTSKNGREKVAYHRDDKSQNCGFCVSKLESTAGTMLYSHLGRYIFTSIQTNVGQINLHYLERSIQ